MLQIEVQYELPEKKENICQKAILGLSNQMKEEMKDISFYSATTDTYLYVLIFVEVKCLWTRPEYVSFIFYIDDILFVIHFNVNIPYSWEFKAIIAPTKDGLELFLV